MKRTLLLAALLLAPLTTTHAAEKTPKSSGEPTKEKTFYTPEQDKASMKTDAPRLETLPNVLILGDSISSGYTNQVREGLEGSAKLAAQVVAAISENLEKTKSSPSPVIDCHVHLYLLSRPEGITWIKKDNEKLFRDHLPEEYAAIAKANGVSGVVIVQAGQSLPDNQWNLDISSKNKDLFRGVVGNLSTVIGTDEFAPVFKKLCEDPRYLGYRISGRYMEKLSDPFYRDLETTAKAGKSVDFLVGDYSLKEVSDIAHRVPDLRIIIDHFGGIQLDGKPLDPEWVKDFRAVAELPNVYCKVSALFGRVAEQPAPKELAFYNPILDLAFESFGEDRIVYGSDWPVSKTTAEYESVLKLTRSYFDPKGPVVCEKLFHRNAEKFYAIPAME